MLSEQPIAQSSEPSIRELKGIENHKPGGEGRGARTEATTRYSRTAVAFAPKALSKELKEQKNLTKFDFTDCFALSRVRSLIVITAKS